MDDRFIKNLKAKEAGKGGAQILTHLRVAQLTDGLTRLAPDEYVSWLDLTPEQTQELAQALVKAPLRVFIIDDQKPIKAALAEARFWNGLHWEPTENDPKEIQVSIARSMEDGLSVIQVSEPFDVWLVDGDLGGANGFEFMQKAFALYPGKIPADIRSCSANSYTQSMFPKHVERLRNLAKVPDTTKKSEGTD